MPDLTIYSIGDTEYLREVLNGLAALTSSSTNNGQFVFASFGRALQVGFLIGLLVTIVKSMVFGRMRLADFMLSLILAVALFHPKARVYIEDLYTGNVVQVDNVPLGPALIGSVTSTLGYRITDLFETAYSLPSDTARLTSGGFVSPIKALLDARRALMQHLGQANSPSQGVDVRHSIVNYIKDCTLVGVSRNEKSTDDIERNPDILQAIRWDSPAYGTRLYLADKPDDLDCTTAYGTLESYINGPFYNGLLNKLKADFSNDPAFNAESHIQDALEALGQSAINARSFILTAVIIPMYEEALSAHRLDMMEFAAAQMIQQAIMQRNAQWAAQYSVFERYVRPMLTFIEGFVYAISPLVLFAITLGGYGLRVVAMYLTVSLWIQLWMPILAVINFYTNMVVTGQMANLASAQYAFPSIAGVLQSDWLLQDWYGVSGILASSAPAIAFMVVSGSAVAMTHLVGRLEGSDTINEKIVSPDIVQPAPVLRAYQTVDHHPVTGMHVPGATQAVPTINLGKEASQAAEAATRQAHIYSQNFVEQFEHSFGRQASQITSGEQARAFYERVSSSTSAVDSWVKNRVEEEAQRRGWNEQDKAYATAMLGLSMDFLRPFSTSSSSTTTQTPGTTTTQGTTTQGWKRIGEAVSKALRRASDLGLDVGGNIRGHYELGSGWHHNFEDGVRSILSKMEQHSDELARAVQSDASHGIRQVASTGWTDNDLKKYSESAQEVLEWSKTLSETEKLTKHAGVSGSYNLLTIGNTIVANRPLFSELGRAVSDLGIKGQVIQLAERMSEQFLMPFENAYAAAAVRIMLGEAGNLPENIAGAAQTIGFNIAARAVGARPPEINVIPKPGDAPELGVRDRVEQNLKRPLSQVEMPSVPGEAAVKDFHEQNIGKTSAKMPNDPEPVIPEDVRPWLEKPQKDMFIEEVSNWAGEKVGQVKEVVKDVGEKASQAYQNLTKDASEYLDAAKQKAENWWNEVNDGNDQDSGKNSGEGGSR